MPCQLGHRCLPKRGAIHTLDQPVFILLSHAASVEDYKLLEALNQATSEKLGELSGKAEAMREGDAVPPPPSPPWS